MSYANEAIEAPPPQQARLVAIFGFLLLAATSIPFCAAAFGHYIAKAPIVPIDAVIGFIAAIHVPMTAYLFFDPQIRRRCSQQPFLLIGGPILIFAACFGVFVAAKDQPYYGPLAVYFITGILAWQFWHFGKQNLGVYSFVRLTAARPGTTGIERNVILLGSALGVAVTFAHSGKALIKQYAGDNPTAFALLLGANDYVVKYGQFTEYALLAFVLGYIAFNWRRFSVRLALMLVMCSSYFFPFYLQITEPNVALIVGCSTFGHGIQYLVFLGFHATQYGQGSRAARTVPGWVIPTAMTFAFVVMAAFCGDFYIYHKFIPRDLGISQLLHRGDLGAPIFLTLVFGILLVHFYLDSFFWRFKSPDARAWMMERYAFLFKSLKPRPTVQTVPVPVPVLALEKRPEQEGT